MDHRFGRFYGLILLAAGCACGLSPAGASPQADGSAAPVHHASVRHHRRHTPVRPVAPLAAATPSAPATPVSSPAPVPNESVAAPIEDPAPQTSVAPSVFQLHYPPQGDGYTTGSSSQAMDDREAAKATGVEVKVPLPQ